MTPGIKGTSLENFREWLSKAWHRNGSTLLMYLASALGALSKSYFDSAIVGSAFDISSNQVIFAFVVSAVTFPLIFESVMKTKRRRGIPDFIIYFMAYQSGFFWQTLLTQFGIK